VSGRTGILFAAPGTTCPAALGAYDQISRAAASRFPGVELRWIYTSAGIRNKLAAQGLPVKRPAEALTAMQAEGIARVAVVSLHLSDGMEFGELAAAVDAFLRQPGTTMKAVLGHTLMTCEADWRRALGALLAGLPGTPNDRERVILVAHGSHDPQAAKTLEAAAQQCRRVDPRLILGMMIGSPGVDDVVRDCLAAGVKKVWLLPCMVVAGYSMREDIAGPGERSWATVLTRAGVETLPVIRGLGEVAGVVDIWMDQAEWLLAKAMERG